MSLCFKINPKLRKYRFETVITIIYLIIHLINLTALPIFCDEAIYINWSQLINSNCEKYIFTSLRDGKTPLFIWMLSPLQLFINEPLFAARILSVLVGLIQIWVLKYLTKIYGGKKQSQLLAMILGSILPFWYLHHRLAIIAATLTLWLSLSLYFQTKAIKQKQKYFISKYHLLSGLFLGMALLTKTSALIFIPGLLSYFLLVNSKKRLPIKLAGFSLSILIATNMLNSLKYAPGFKNLFIHGQRFMFGLDELGHELNPSLVMKRFHNNLFILNKYLSWPILSLSILGLFTSKKKQVLSLHLTWLLYFLFFVLFGKIIYPRYLVPVSIGLTVTAAISFTEIYQYKKRLFKFISVSFLSLSIALSLKSIYHQSFDISHIPLVSRDRNQYLYKSTAGFGVKDSMQIINGLGQDNSVLVLSEGHFGTLPQSLWVYQFHKSNDNVYIKGIGSLTRKNIESMKQSINSFDRILLAGNQVNRHLSLDQKDLLFEACRPPKRTSCYQLWELRQTPATKESLTD